MLERLKSLWAKHEILEFKIDVEQRRLKADHIRLSSLKRMKLAVRDEIVALERHIKKQKQIRRNSEFA